jgi:ferredoxin
MGFRVRIDKNSCQSSGNCVEAEAAAFGFDDDGLGDVLAPAAKLERARLIEIAKRCPALAITVFDDAGNELETHA